MRLFLLGATGRTGQELTRQALERGHSVTASVRAPEKMSIWRDRVQILAGDPLDPEQLTRGLDGHDAVVSALGATSRAPTTVCSDGARSTILAMQRSGVRRLLVTSSALLYPDLGGLPGRFVGYLFRHVLADTRQMEAQVEASDLDWTIVRPPRLTNGKPTGRYRVAHGPPSSGSIARPDLARCLLDAVGQTAYSKRVIGVSK